MPTDPVTSEWITVEEATDERLATAVAGCLRREGVPVRLTRAEPSDRSGQPGGLTVQVPLDFFELALEVLEGLDEEAP